MRTASLRIGYLLAGAVLAGAAPSNSAPEQRPVNEIFSEALRDLRVERYRDAIDLLEFGLKQQPNDQDAILILGEAYQKSGDKNNAKIYYNKILEISSRSDLIELAQDHLRELSNDCVRVSQLGLYLIPEWAEARAPGLMNICQIEKSSDAEIEGLKLGDTIISINQREVRSLVAVNEAIDAVKSSGRNAVLLLIKRGNNAPVYVGLAIR